jgi:hypothetical protein
MIFLKNTTHNMKYSLKVCAANTTNHQICKGPSLRKVNLDALGDTNVIYFGLNKLIPIFDETPLRLNYMLASNSLVIEQNLEFFHSTNIPVFLNSVEHRVVKNSENVTFFNLTPIPQKFARDCSISLFRGYTVTYVTWQLAFHMGFGKVALIGCDHHFVTDGPANKTVNAGETDPNHFHPKYFADGVKWDLPDLLGSEHHYDLADKMYRHFGRRIYNCTEGGNLEIFERKELADFLSM